MAQTRLVLVLTLFVASCASGGVSETDRGPDGELDPRIVFDKDDRLDWYAEESAQWRDIADRSAVALIRASWMEQGDPTNVRLVGPTLAEKEDVCTDQAFANQIAVSQCSGTLIGPDLVLTAGHCVKTQADCDIVRFVFNYYHTSPTERARMTGNDIYSCGELLTSRKESGADGTLDHAIIRLDRPVTADKRPVPIRAATMALEEGTAVTAIGSPSGVPVKIASNATVTDSRDGRNLDYFETDLDVFPGSSGSGAFNDQGEVVGIVVRTQTPHYVDNPADPSCKIPNVRPNGASGTEVSYISTAIEDACSRHPSLSICGGDSGTPIPKPSNTGSMLHAQCQADGLAAVAFEAAIDPLETLAPNRPIGVRYTVTKPFQFEGNGTMTFTLASGKPQMATGTVDSPTGSGTMEMTCGFGGRTPDGGGGLLPEPGTQKPLDKNGLSGAKDSQTPQDTFEVPPNAVSVKVEISGGSGDADLYVRQGSAPTLTEWDCRPFKSGSNERCFFLNPTPGTWHIMLVGVKDYAGVALSVEVRTDETRQGPNVPNPEAYQMECSVDGLDGLTIGFELHPNEELMAGQEATVNVAFPGPFGIELSAGFTFAFEGAIPMLAVGALPTVLGLLGVNCAVVDWPNLIDAVGAFLSEAITWLGNKLSGGAGTEQSFAIQVPADATTLVVEATEGIGDADLYVKRGSVPVVGQEACPPGIVDPFCTDADGESGGRQDERVDINNPEPGLWHVLVFGADEYADVDVSAWVVK